MINLKNSLNKYFGFESFRTGQEEIIYAIIKGEQAITVLPTGGGKSLCYQLPALISDNFSIIFLVCKKSSVFSVGYPTIMSVLKVPPFTIFLN